MVPKKAWLVGFVALAVTGCSLRSASPPRSGPVPQQGFPSSKVLAAWLERPYQPPDGPTRLVLYEDGGHTHVLPSPLVASPRGGYVLTIRLSPDGTKIGAVIRELEGSPPAPTEKVHVIDLTSGATVATLPGGYNGIAWSPDSTRLVIANLGKRASPDPPAAQVVSLTGAVPAHLTSGFDPEWAPSGDISLKAYDAGNKVAVFDPDGRRLPSPVEPTPGPTLCSGAVSPDGKTAVEVASGPPGFGNESDSFLEACEVATGRKRRLSPNYVPIDLETGNGWLPNGSFATLVGDAFETIAIATGHQDVVAHAPRSAVYNSLVVVPWTLT
jgi:hypothetical protein